MNEILSIERLSKNYGAFTAVDAISLQVQRGEIYGFLGLNGAGKTTTIRMLLGMINPSRGEARIFGQKVRPGKLDIWHRIGYLVEVPYAYPNLTVYENLDIIRKLRGIKDKQAVGRIIAKMGLSAYANRQARHLSLGNGQRLGLAKALIHEPELLILDEPTNGLDPSGIHEIRQLLLDLAKNHGVTIFISSHILTEISKTADRVGIIHEGRMKLELDSRQLAGNHRSLHIQVKAPQQAITALQSAGVEIRQLQGELVTDHTDAIEHPDKIAELLVQAGCGLTGLTVSQEDLESIFLHTIQSKAQVS